MKTLQKTLLAIGVLALLLPVLEGCKKGPNDPGISLKSRDNRISAVWKLSGGSYTATETITYKLEYNDGDCEDVIGNSQEADVTVTRTNTQNFSSGAVSFSRIATSDRKWWGGTEFSNWQYGGESTSGVSNPLPGSEWADGQVISRNITYSLEITIKKDGTFDATVTAYSLYEEDYPVGFGNQNNNQELGNTLSGSWSGSGNWWWMSDSKKKSGIMFEGFPMLWVSVTGVMEWDGSVTNPEDEFDYNYVDEIKVMTQTMLFDIDRLAGKELTLTSIGTDNDSWKEVSDEWEGFELQNLSWIDCISTETNTYNSNWNGTWNFTSDGKNVKE